jgi:hypothetical protein
MSSRGRFSLLLDMQHRICWRTFIPVKFLFFSKFHSDVYLAGNDDKDNS